MVKRGESNAAKTAANDAPESVTGESSANNLVKPAATVADTATGTAQSPFTCTTENGAVTITKYTGPGGDVTIPDKINGLPVTTIGFRAFSDFRESINVTMPNSVTIGNNVSSIGGYAFHICTSLTSGNSITL